MKKPTRAEIVAALKVLREALSQRFGDAAACASLGDGCDIDVRCSGIDLMDENSSYLVEDGEPEEIAVALIP